MSEQAADYYAMAADSKKRRRRNRNQSAHILRQRCVEFTEHNKGAHLIVKTASGVIDFWPGTGKYTIRKTGESGRGVFNLLKEMKIN